MKNNDNNNHPSPTDHSGAGSKRMDKADVAAFSGFQDDDAYEEPDRDTDFSSIFREDNIEDEEFADTLFEEEDLESSEQAPWTISNVSEEPEPALALQTPGDDGRWDDSDEAPDLPDPDQENEWEEDLAGAQGKNQMPSQFDDVDDDWDEDEYRDEEEEIKDPQRWPLGLIVVALVALILIMAGGYGVIQQRSATQEEIRTLQAALATSVDPGEVTEIRDALTGVEQRNTELQRVVDVLTLENRRLSDTVTGLESQLDAQQEVLTVQPSPVPAEPKPQPKAKPKPAPQPKAELQPKAKPKPEPQPKPQQPQPQPQPQPEKITPPAATQAAPASPVTTIPTGNVWFVNFASYGVRATAQNWVEKLDPSAGKAVIATTTKDGRTFYRVRVIDLPNREAADQVAKQLANKHGLPKLWVGRE